jgi:hypothetical protein
MKLEATIGLKFGRLTILKTRPANRRNLFCRCNCGNTGWFNFFKVKSGHTKSCGCLARDCLIKRNTSHGKTSSREYKIWSRMKTRCYFPAHQAYKHYGGRGIKVCKRWLGKNGFKNFLNDLGESPPGSSIERLDVNKDYSPLNCKWIPLREQGRNRRNTFRIDGEPLYYWEQKTGIKANTLWQRIKICGWTEAKALSQPNRERKKV